MGAPLRLRTLRKRLTDSVSVCALVVFSVIWSLQMYLSFYGSLSPHPETGELYGIPVHGATVYVKRWEYYLASPQAMTFGILLMGLFVYLHRGSNSSRKSDP